MRHLAAGLVAALLAAVIGAAASAQTPSPTPSPTPTPTPLGPAFGGVAPSAGGVGLLVTTRSVHRSDLTNDFAAKGCAVGTLGLLMGGQWALYIVGAPAVVNQAFPTTLGATVPFFVRCGDGAPPKVMIDAGSRGVPGAGAVAGGVPATAIAYRFQTTGVDLTNLTFAIRLSGVTCPPSCPAGALVLLGTAWTAFSRGGGSTLSGEGGPVIGFVLFMDATAPAGAYPFTVTFPDGRVVQGTVNHTP
jgi:hypothetical protein